MKIMVLGARGMLGTDLMLAFASDAPLGLDLPEMDITDARMCRERVREFGPDVIVNAAALTNVDYCESHAGEAFLVNGEAAGNVAQAAAAAGSLMVHYSTDYVFDGAKRSGYLEDDATGPISVYGKSKLRGEELVRSCCADHLILRTAWLFGCHGKNFIRTIVEAARAGRNLRVVDDQLGSPTYSLDLAALTRAIIMAGLRGTCHATNSGACTWFELARKAVAWAGLSGIEVEPVTTEDFPRPAPRPACSILIDTRLRAAGLPTMRHWEEAARDYILTCLSETV